MYRKIEEKVRLVNNIELHYAEIVMENSTVALCICRDAYRFSPQALRRLLLSDSGTPISAAVALSLWDGELKMRSEALK